MEKGPLTPQAEVLETAFKVYHVRNDKARNHYHVVAMAALPAKATDYSSRPVRAVPRLPGCVSHQVHVSSAVRRATGPEDALIPIVIPGDLVQGVTGKVTGL